MVEKRQNLEEEVEMLSYKKVKIYLKSLKLLRETSEVLSDRK